MLRLAALALLLSPASRTWSRAETSTAWRPSWRRPRSAPGLGAFRREAEAADANWNRDLRRIMSAETFDARSAGAAADAAHRDAGRLIAAWQKVDEGLSPGQRAALRRDSFISR